MRGKTIIGIVDAELSILQITNAMRTLKMLTVTDEDNGDTLKAGMLCVVNTLEPALIALNNALGLTPE